MTKVPPIPSIHLQSMQAESMVQAALQGGENFTRAAKTFFKTTNDAFPVVNREGEMLINLEKDKPNGLSNAIIALFTTLNKAEKEASKINRTDSFRTKLNKLFGHKKSVREIFMDKFESVAKDDPELKKEASLLFTKFKVAHPKSWQNRLIAARSGRIRAGEVHKPTRMEKFSAFIDALLNKEV